MVRRLRKVKLDGTPYARRPEVETDILALKQLAPDQLEARCALWPKNVPGFVSSEALVHFVRVADSANGLRERLLKLLMTRVYRRLPKPDSADGTTASLSVTFIRDRVRDQFIDLILSDHAEYNEQLDYFEVSFGNALALDRLDAQRQVWKEENRSTALGSDDDPDGISAEVEAAVEGYNPFDADELDKKDYRRLLGGAINTLPLVQQRIVEMIRQEIPIDSSDPKAVTISKTLGKAEKTIRNQRDRAFATLRRRLSRKEEA